MYHTETISVCMLLISMTKVIETHQNLAFSASDFQFRSRALTFYP